MLSKPFKRKKLYDYDDIQNMLYILYENQAIKNHVLEKIREFELGGIDFGSLVHCIEECSAEEFNRYDSDVCEKFINYFVTAYDMSRVSTDYTWHFVGSSVTDDKGNAYKYYVSAKKDNRYGIKDMSDGIVEYFDVAQIEKYFRDTKIAGITFKGSKAQVKVVKPV